MNGESGEEITTTRQNGRPLCSIARRFPILQNGSSRARPICRIGGLRLYAASLDSSPDTGSHGFESDRSHFTVITLRPGQVSGFKNSRGRFQNVKTSAVGVIS
eukprot:1970073-Pleurochrysis_carterae.AAC.1